MLSQARYRSIFLVSDSIVVNGLIVLLASLVLAVVSQIALPWLPVPLTFQSAMVVLLGLTLGSKRAAAAVALYLLEGACGLPVFAQGYAGFAVFMMSSGGYLWGFIPAAFLAGWMMEQGMAKNVLTIFATALISTSIIFVFGALRLAALFGWKKAYLFGVQPFLITEPVKLIIATIAAKFCFKEA
ncbi:MAG: biotin transporter BioY [Gammaproteobacteria bacterium]|nr:biotin transporter BioY [Gammaproteobacteria bacterium]